MAKNEEEKEKPYILSEDTAARFKAAVERKKAEREKERFAEGVESAQLLRELSEAQQIKDLAALQEVLQENRHLIPPSGWGRSIILVAADIIREYGKEGRP